MPPLARRLRLSAIGVLVLAAGCSGLPLVGSHRGADKVGKLAPAEAADVQVALGRSLEADGDTEKAMIAYREALARAPKRADAHVRMAVLLDRLGRFAESAPHYEAALKASPGDAEIFCDRGYSLALQNRPSEAEAALKQAITLKPDLARAHNNLGLLLGRAGRSAEALAEFRKAGCPEPDAHLNLAFALGEAHRWDEANGQLAAAREKGANVPEVEAAASQIQGLIAKGEMARPSVDPAVQTAGAPGTGSQ